jgi:hypothetical protein
MMKMRTATQQSAYDTSCVQDNLVMLRAWIRHWKADAEGNLKPTISSLEQAEFLVSNALAVASRSSDALRTIREGEAL